MLGRSLASLTKTEAAYEQTIEDASNIVEVEGEEDQTETEEASEQATLDTFTDKVEEVRALADEMITLKQAHRALEDFRIDVEALQDNVNADPEKEHSASRALINAAYRDVRKLISSSTVESEHPLRQELNHFSTLICRPSTNDKLSLATLTIPSTMRASKTVQLPKIHLPTFDGNLMNWSTFWCQFRVAVNSNADLSKEHKLAYLRDAVQDPSTKHLLFSGTEWESLYSKVVELLKQRFDQRRIIHTNYCQTLTQLGPVKSTKADLHQFVDTVRHAISRLKLTEQFDIRSLLTSILHPCLSKSLQAEWEVHSNKIKGVPPVEDFLDFVMFSATVLSTQPPVPPTNVLDHKPEKRQERKLERKPEYYQRHRAPMHVATPSGGFKYECLLRSPKKHPLNMCAKWGAYTWNQRNCNTFL